MAVLDNAFLEALNGQDQLGVVIRAHIHVEAGLNGLLDLLVPHPPLLPRLRYEQKVNLACALGLKEDAGPPLRKLGDIRNRFGHHLDTQLTDGMVMDLYDSFSKDDKQTVLDAYAQTNAQLDVELPKDFTALSARDKFVLIAVILDKLLAQAREELYAMRKHT